MRYTLCSHIPTLCYCRRSEKSSSTYYGWSTKKTQSSNQSLIFASPEWIILKSPQVPNIHENWFNRENESFEGEDGTNRHGPSFCEPSILLRQFYYSYEINKKKKTERTITIYLTARRVRVRHQRSAGTITLHKWNYII